VTDNEKLIEEARRVQQIDLTARRSPGDPLYPSSTRGIQALRDMIGELLAVFEKAHTPTAHAKESDTSPGRVKNGADSSHVAPTDDEREALAQWLHLRFGKNQTLDWDALSDRFKAAWRDLAGDAPLGSCVVPEPTAEPWSTEDRREAVAEGLRRWSVQGQHDRVEQRDHDLYGMGARQGFALGAEWWKSTHAAPEPQGEPSDSQVLAALNRYYVPDGDPAQKLSAWSEGSIRAMRAALRAASAVTEQGEPSHG